MMDKNKKAMIIGIPAILLIAGLMFVYINFMRKPKEEPGLTPVDDEITLTGDDIIRESEVLPVQAGEITEVMTLSAEYATDAMVTDENKPIYTWENKETREKVVRPDINQNTFEYYIDDEYMGEIYYDDDYQCLMYSCKDLDILTPASDLLSLRFPTKRIDVQGTSTMIMPKEAYYGLDYCLEQYLNDYYPGNDFHFAYYEENSIGSPTPDYYSFWINIPDLNYLEIKCKYYVSERGYDFESILNKTE